MGRVVVLRGTTGVDVAFGRRLLRVGVGVEVGRKRVAVGSGRVSSNLASSALTLVSSALTSLLSALSLVKADTICVSPNYLADRPSSVSED